MRSSIDGPDVFFRKMKKKPALQAILDNLDSYTEDQLSRVDGQPLWIRQCLINLKQNNGEFALTRDEIADAMLQAGEPQLVTDIEGELFEWVGQPAWLGDDVNGKKFEQEIVTGEPLFRITADSCYIGDTIVQLSNASQHRISANTRSHGIVTRSIYKDVHRKYLELKHGKVRT